MASALLKALVFNSFFSERFLHVKKKNFRFFCFFCFLFLRSSLASATLLNHCKHLDSWLRTFITQWILLINCLWPDEKTYSLFCWCSQWSRISVCHSCSNVCSNFKTLLPTFQKIAFQSFCSCLYASRELSQTFNLNSSFWCRFRCFFWRVEQQPLNNLKGLKVFGLMEPSRILLNIDCPKLRFFWFAGRGVASWFTMNWLSLFILMFSFEVTLVWTHHH